MLWLLQKDTDMKNLKKVCLKFCDYIKSNPKIVIPLVIFLFALSLRILSFYPDRMVFGYDQVEDLLNTKKVVKYHDLVIMGRIAAGSSNTHHGASFFYYMVPPFILGNGNPTTVAIWNSIFNSFSVIILFFLAIKLFGSYKAAILTAILAAVSYQSVQYAGWLSNPTTLVFLVPLFFLCLWFYYKGSDRSLIFSFALLGLIIQSQIFMLYLVFVIPVYWFVLKPKFPNFKTSLLSVLALITGLSTMILTEFKLKFAGVNALLHFSDNFAEAKTSLAVRLNSFVINFIKTFSLNIWPDGGMYAEIFSLLIIFLFIFYIIFRKNKRDMPGVRFLLIYIFSPFLMLPFGYHKQPWTFIGIIPAVALFAGYIFSKINNKIVLTVIIAFISFVNIRYIFESRNGLDFYIRQEPPSILFNQIGVMDYTYRESGGEPFSINSVTYPLYSNTYWSYHYPWYGIKKYGYLPSWRGGDQLYPYNSLSGSAGSEKYSYMIIDNSSSIPLVHRLAGKQWAAKNGKLVKEIDIGGYTVIKMENIKQ